VSRPSVALSTPRLRPSGPDAVPPPLPLLLDGLPGVEGSGRWRLWCLDLGLACCAVEVVAAAAGRRDAATPRRDDEADVLVVAGTVTDKLAPVVLRVPEQLPRRPYVLSFGSCANSGGPYWDSYCVTKGVDQLLPVDVYVPGCPPRPEALLQGLLRLHAGIADGTVSAPR
jgi:NADH-quinone oxidoreductase subunit B